MAPDCRNFVIVRLYDYMVPTCRYYKGIWPLIVEITWVYGPTSRYQKSVWPPVAGTIVLDIIGIWHMAPVSRHLGAGSLVWPNSDSTSGCMRGLGAQTISTGLHCRE